MDPIDDWASLNAALMKQARVVNNLRRRIETLEKAMETASTTQAAIAAALPPGLGTFVPSDLCVMCGQAKEPGRKRLTCRTCSTERQAIIASGQGRSITRSVCCSCGATFKAQTRFLCPSCTAGYKMYMAAETHGP